MKVKVFTPKAKRNPFQKMIDDMLRKQYEREVMNPPHVQSYPPIAQPTLIEGAIQKAKELLAIEGDVIVEFHDHDCIIPNMGPTLGNYNARGAMTNAHHIRLSLTMNRDHERLEQCLWHELTHAAQRDRYPDHTTYQRAYNSTPDYFNNPFEKEARRNERRSWPIKLLEVPQ